MVVWGANGQRSLAVGWAGRRGKNSCSGGSAVCVVHKADGGGCARQARPSVATWMGAKPDVSRGRSVRVSSCSKPRLDAPNVKVVLFGGASPEAIVTSAVISTALGLRPGATSAVCNEWS